MVFLTKHVVEHSIKLKVEKARRRGGWLKLIAEMEKKMLIFSAEIDKAEVDLAKTKEAKKALIKKLTEAEDTHTELKSMQDGKNRELSIDLIC